MSVNLSDDVAFFDAGLVRGTVFEDGGNVDAPFDVRDFQKAPKLGVARGRECHSAFREALVTTVGDVAQEMAGNGG